MDLVSSLSLHCLLPPSRHFPLVQLACALLVVVEKPLTRASTCLVFLFSPLCIGKKGNSSLTHTKRKRQLDLPDLLALCCRADDTGVKTGVIDLSLSLHPCCCC